MRRWPPDEIPGWLLALILILVPVIGTVIMFAFHLYGGEADPGSCPDPNFFTC